MTTVAAPRTNPSADGGTGGARRRLAALTLCLALVLGALATAGPVGVAAATNHAEFEVDSVSPVEDSIVESDVVTVEATISNTGAAAGNAPVSLREGGDTRDSQTVEVGPGDSRAVSLEWDTTGVSSGTHTLTVDVGDDSTTTEVTVTQLANVDGTIVDNATGAPIEGATVTLQNATTEATVATTSTGAGGTYQFEDVRAGGTAYDVVADASDYTAASGTVVLPDGGATATLGLWRALAGEGTSESPYVVTNVAELQSVEGDLSAEYVLGNDVDASAAVEWNDDAGFVPLGGDAIEYGESDVPDGGFTGSLDGQGYAITDLSLATGGESLEPSGFTGLFALLGTSGTVENVHLDDATAVGHAGVGTLAGTNVGTIANVSVRGDVSGATVLGGVVGANLGTISNTSAAGNVTVRMGESGPIPPELAERSIETRSIPTSPTPFGDVGGLAGWNVAGGTITDATATADVRGVRNVGGLVGQNVDATIEGSSAAGTVTGTTAESAPDEVLSLSHRSSEAFGGLVGLNTGSVTNSWASGDVNATRNGLSVGGLIGRNGQGGGEGSEQLEQPATELAPGTATNVSATGSVAGEYEVGGLVGANNGVVVDASASGDVSGEQPVGGLIGYNPGGTVVDSWASGDVTGEDDFVGGLIGMNYVPGGELEATVTTQEAEFGPGVIANTSASGDVAGEEDAVGGLIGENFGGVVVDAFASGDVNGRHEVGGLVGNNDEASITSSYATGDVSGEDAVGGLVGSNDHAPIATTYATGDVDAGDRTGGLVGENEIGSITRSYAGGHVSGLADVGGLVGVQIHGEEDVATVTDSYWGVDATGQSSSDGGVGLTNEELTGGAAATNADGFDFASNWTVTDSSPMLRWSVTEYSVTVGSTDFEAGDSTNASASLSLVDGRTVGATLVSAYASDDGAVASTDDRTVTGEGTGETSIEGSLAAWSDAVTVTIRPASTGGGATGGGTGGGVGGGASTSDRSTPDIAVTAVSADRTELEPGQSVDVAVTLTNEGDGDGVEDVELLVDREVVDGQSVLVHAGGKQSFTFTRTFETTGTYSLAIDDFAETVVVAEATATPVDDEPSVEGTPERTPDETPTPTPDDGPVTDEATPTDGGGAAPEPDEGGGFPIAMVLAGLVVISLLGVGVLSWSNDR